ncbi:unnamed protein product [Brassica oleracea var. botrytis]|uniref:Ubiquitin-like protease family profile domain-containing protein n=1 Tax=Brassica oleracea TaxID=3712 RepID=A0A3P6EFJ1_BRAOL|nr:unnamed protein product [Brassica oleracea]
MYRTWSRDDRLRLGYLAIYAGFIEAPRTSSPTRASLARLVMDLDAFEDYPWERVAFKFLMESVKGVDLTKTYAIEGFVEVLQVWVYNCLPEFRAGFGQHIEGFLIPPLLAFLGGKGKRKLQENILKQFYLLQTRTNNFTVKAYSEMFPRWDGDLEDEKADNIVKTMFSSGRAWEQIHWPLVGRKLWTNVKVEIHPMKTEAGQMVRSKKAVSPSRTESEAESRKKARDSPGLDTKTMKAEIVRWLTGLTSNMVEGMSRCENTLKSQSRMIKGLTAKMRAVEKIVREGWKEDQTKAGSSTDVPEANKSDGDKAKEDRAEESKAKESKAEESKAAVTSPKPIRMTRAKAKDAQATVSESENENGGISVVVMDKEQSNIDYCYVKKLKQVGKLRAARIVARAKSERQRRLAATHHSPFDGNSTAKVIIPNQSKRGQGYNPFASVDHQKLFVLLDWVKLDLKWRQKVPGYSSFWFYTLLTPTKWLSDTHPEWFRSDRICMLDVVFTQMWKEKYSEFLASPANPDGSGKLLPPGALDYYTCEEPAYCRSNKTWALEIDDIYAPLFVKNNHWVACWISIPRRHKVIWDSDVAYAKDAEIAKTELYTVDFTHSKFGVPQKIQSGDCGVYCLKYIECHALGMSFPPHELCDKKIKTIRSQMATEIFDETSINGTEKHLYKHLGVYD